MFCFCLTSFHVILGMEPLGTWPGGEFQKSCCEVRGELWGWEWVYPLSLASRTTIYTSWYNAGVGSWRMYWNAKTNTRMTGGSSMNDIVFHTNAHVLHHINPQPLVPAVSAVSMFRVPAVFQLYLPYSTSCITSLMPRPHLSQGKRSGKPRPITRMW